MSSSSCTPPARICRVCGDAIGAARLAVRPYALRCIDCANKVYTPPILMLRQHRGDNEFIDTMFTPADRPLLKYLKYTNRHLAGQSAFDAALGDAATPVCASLGSDLGPDWLSI